MVNLLDLPNAVGSAVGSSSAQLGAMVAGRLYMLTCTTATWVAQGANPTAVAAAAATVLVGAGGSLILDGQNGAKAAVLQESAAGHCSLAPIRRNGTI